MIYKVAIALVCIMSFSSATAAGKNRIRFKISVELAKTEYKEFEPIDILINCKNAGSISDSLFSFDFNFFNGYMRCCLTNENGVEFKSKDITRDLILGFRPDWILAPGDSMLFNQEINTCGNILNKSDSSYFTGYFLPPGNYTGYLYWNQTYRTWLSDGIRGLDAESITKKSNEFHFTVYSADAYDMQVLKKMKNSGVDTVLNQHQFNEYKEYMYRERFRNIYISQEDTVSKTKAMMDFINDYFSSYPDSYYCLNYIYRYIIFESPKDEIVIESKINDLVEKYKGTIIERYLNNHLIRSDLINGIMNDKFVKF